MIYCAPDPGLFILDGLAPHETQKAFSVVKALILHKNQIVKAKAKIPVTADYLACVYTALGRVPFSDPPLASTLKEYIVAMLAQQTVPAFPSTGVTDTQIKPDITSPWIKDDVKELWLDCLVAGLEDVLASSTDPSSPSKLLLATWERDRLPLDVELLSDQVGNYLELDSNSWLLPLLAHEHDWVSFLADNKDWPNGLDKVIESYARRHLGISLENLSKRHEVRFERPCLVSISDEKDSEIRKLIIEVIGCRAYDHPKVNHHDEPIKAQLGMRRVYVKKMNPPIRLHYYFDQGTVVYALYSKGDHDKGL